MLSKNVFKNIMHLLLYVLIIGLIILICFCFGQSFNGYRINKLDGSYVHLKTNIIYTFHDLKVEIIEEDGSILKDYKLMNGIIYVENKEFILYEDGILDISKNDYYQKAPFKFSLKYEIN